MSGLYDAAVNAHRALCELEDELDARAAAHMPASRLTDSERDGLRLVVSRWSVDTDRKIKRAL